MLPPVIATPTRLPRNRSGNVSSAATPTAPAPSATVLAPSASSPIASSTARSGTTSMSVTRRRTISSGTSPMSRTAMPSAMVGPPTETVRPATRCAIAA